ncbi:MAG: DUF885 domain-containing protein, partial [Candidatus Omnitrophica bacterium]|nr:DUF885 domain-containing protein [Candidatus Omnitrophota bacterium]
KQNISHLKGLKRQLEKLNPEVLNLEAQIDLGLLKQSIATFLREFQQAKIWQYDPSLYLKIILLGIDQITNRFALVKEDTESNLRARIAQIPRLLKEARENLKKSNYVYMEVAVEMAQATIDYFRDAQLPLKKGTLKALEEFKTFLLAQPLRKFVSRDRDFLESVLKDSFSYKRDLKDIFDIAQAEYEKTINRLAETAARIDPNKSWQKILAAYKVRPKNSKELLGLYAGQVQRLKDFFQGKDIIAAETSQDIKVRQTPGFMRPVRASASYSAPVTTDRRESGYFYITADYGQVESSESSLYGDIHSEYIFVSAHETYPGHHLLDTLRRNLKNPIRRQIESPFFYEGWASYAEWLIDELGYIDNPLQRLVGLRRQAWRTVRAMLDIGIRIDKFKAADAQRMLEGLGYEHKTVKSMVRHYLLTPGYQLCYTIGKFEIENLRKKFEKKLGLKKFHQLLLDGGQIPFDMVARRIEEYLCQRNS